jgi:hypothetical protein
MGPSHQLQQLAPAGPGGQAESSKIGDEIVVLGNVKNEGWRKCLKIMERPIGIEPTPEPW